MRKVLAAPLLLMLTASGAAAQSNEFHWNGPVQAGKAIEIKGVNGSITAEFASGNQVEVTASKRARRSDVNSVSVQVVQQDGNVTICAVYPTPSPSRRTSSRNRDRGPNECRPGT